MAATRCGGWIPNLTIGLGATPFSGWSEPGVIWVQEDRNENNIPDEMWYELEGEYKEPNVIRRFVITYFKAAGVSASQNAWVDGTGLTGIIYGGYPRDAGTWVAFTGTLLKIDSSGTGYVDSMGSGTAPNDYARFYVSAAIRADGTSISLDAVRFIKVHTGVFVLTLAFGEKSTEIYEADGLGKQSDFPLPENS
jgi:hypothetical protein